MIACPLNFFYFFSQPPVPNGPFTIFWLEFWLRGPPTTGMDQKSVQSKGILKAAELKGEASSWLRKEEMVLSWNAGAGLKD